MPQPDRSLEAPIDLSRARAWIDAEQLVETQPLPPIPSGERPDLGLSSAAGHLPDVSSPIVRGRSVNLSAARGLVLGT